MTKKYVITEKSTNHILGIGKTVKEMSNGYVWLVDENFAFPPQLVDTYNVNVPTAVEEEYYNYSYTPKDGFLIIEEPEDGQGE